MSFQDELRALNACRAAVEWVGDKNLSTAWDECHRIDWMLWLLLRTRDAIDRKTVVLIACDIAETALKYVPDGEDRPHKAIETARAWCRGDTTLNKVRDAADAARAASATDAADAAADAAAYAAHAAAYAAFTAYAAVSAAVPPAAYAARAADAAASAVYTADMSNKASIIRKHISAKNVEAMYQQQNLLLTERKNPDAAND